MVRELLEGVLKLCLLSTQISPQRVSQLTLEVFRYVWLKLLLNIITCLFFLHLSGTAWLFHVTWSLFLDYDLRCDVASLPRWILNLCHLVICWHKWVLLGHQLFFIIVYTFYGWALNQDVLVCILILQVVIDLFWIALGRRLIFVTNLRDWYNLIFVSCSSFKTLDCLRVLLFWILERDLRWHNLVL